MSVRLPALLLLAAILPGPAAAQCPQADDFLQPARYGDAGSRYPRPDVSAWCDADFLYVRSNGVPSFAIERMTPNTLRPHTVTYRLPRTPRMLPEPAEVPYLGALGVTTTGLPIVAANEGADLGFGDAVTDGIVDHCGGHVDPFGNYHFHAPPGCPYDTAADLASNVVGYASDGIPIMAPYLCVDAACARLRKVRGSWHRCVDDACSLVRVRATRSSWRLARPDARAAWDRYGYVAGSGDLDRCNGMTGPDGVYRYYATESFPYNVGCYRAAVDRDPGGVMIGERGLAPGWSERSTAGVASEPRRAGPGGPPPGASIGQRPPRRGGGPPDLAAAARRLGIDVETLHRALGPPPPDFGRAARMLGIDQRTLMDALHHQ